MKKNKKFILSMGVIASVAIPTIVTTNLINNSNNKRNVGFLNKTSINNGINAYTSTTKTQLVAPNVKPELKDVVSTDMRSGFMTQTSDGSIYVGTFKDGLKKFVNGKLVDVDSTNVTGGFMTQTSDGSIYVGTKSNGLKKLVNGKLVNLDGTTDQAHETLSVENGFITQTSDGSIYVGTHEKGLKKLVNGKLEEVVKADVGWGFVTQTSDGSIYVGTLYRGLQKLVKGKLVDVDSTDLRSGFMTQTSDGSIYVGTYDKGLKKLVNGKLVDVDSTNVTGGFMTQTSDGSIYVGTYDKGLKKLVNGKLEDIDKTDVGAGFITQTSDGSIYVGAFKDGLKKLDFAKVAKVNETFVKNTYDNVEINVDPSKTIKEIVKEIKDLSSLEKYTNIKLPKLNYSTIGKIKVSIDSTNQGKLILEVEVKTQSGIVHTIKTNLSYFNQLKLVNNNSFNILIGNKKIVNQGTNSVSIIADELNKGT
ncbi:hypothetical protein, partial [Mycoplasma todarodis]